MSETESELPEPRDKAEGWYLLHDFRSVDWDEWNALDDESKRG
ncbi:MAG: heme-dependent peroxidase, partial [Halobacteria archaeon]|nr:heme-dependent peroxidase [Halobacteria archaeon]